MVTLTGVSTQFASVAVSAPEPSQRASTGSAGPSDARTQGGGKGSALAPTEDAAGRRVRRRRRCAVGRGEGAKKKGGKKSKSGKQQTGANGGGKK
jgi:hypothetical protein